VEGWRGERGRMSRVVQDTTSKHNKKKRKKDNYISHAAHTALVNVSAAVHDFFYVLAEQLSFARGEERKKRRRT
jgi:hypothetical protein